MRIYHIVPRFDGWAVRAYSAKRASRRFASKADALAWAKARSEHGYSHRRDGTVEAVW